MHKYRNEEKTRMKHFIICFIAEANRVICSSVQQKNVHILQKNESDNLCFECKKKMSSKTSL